MAAAGQAEGEEDSAARTLLLLLLAADALFVAVHVWGSLAHPDWRLLSIEADNGYGELFQYLKFLWLALLLARLAWRRRAVGYLAWSLLFAYLLLDDMLRLHEDLGAALAEDLGLRPWLGLRAKDLGELAVTAIAALLLLAPLSLAWLRGGAAFRALSRSLARRLLLLAGFGVLLDLLASALHPVGGWRLLLGTLEDGGEMVAASLLLARAFAELAPASAATPPPDRMGRHAPSSER